MTQEYNYHTRVMGCDFDMTFIAQTAAQADGYFTQAVKIAQSYEKRFSRFDSNSELFLVNKNKSVEVTQKFLEVYWIAYDLYKGTQTQFNPLVQVSQIGYDRSFDKMTTEKSDDLNKIEYNINLDDIVILSDRMILQDSQKLDFGGFLKGHVAQIIAQKISNSDGVIINIGGDMYVKGVNQDQKAFSLEIAHPNDESKNILISIMNKALCTSGTYKRKWKQNDENKHHILHSDTRDSTKTDVVSASVIHESGAIADAYATLAVTLGSKKAAHFFDERQIKFVIICENDDILVSDDLK